MYFHHVLLDDEMYEFLIGSIVGGMSPVRQQPLWTPADFLLLITEAALLKIVTWLLQHGLAGDG